MASQPPDNRDRRYRACARQDYHETAMRVIGRRLFKAEPRWPKDDGDRFKNEVGKFMFCKHNRGPVHEHYGVRTPKAEPQPERYEGAWESECPKKLLEHYVPLKFRWITWNEEQGRYVEKYATNLWEDKYHICYMG